MIHRRLAPGLAAVCVLVSACGGGGDAPPPAPAGTASSYPRSIALGSWSAQEIDYTGGSSPAQPATVSATTASALLAVGSNVLVAEHVESSLPGARVACVSGRGDSTNVISPINLGVVAQSAAVLLDSQWSPVADSAAAWAAIAARGTELSGWENCGVKPEGLPSRSSALRPQAGGGYSEDVYDGNPSTTFNVITQTVSAAQMAAMLSSVGLQTTEDPLRPMTVYWRIFADGQGRQLLVQMGLPSAGAPASLKGFIALYVLA